MQSVPEGTVVQQQAQFVTLLQNLGQATDAEIERALTGREVVEPEPDLPAEVIQRLQTRLTARPA
ncbi:MAG: hypothetical protein AB1791_19340 [Chloroflexota bacterium]